MARFYYDGNVGRILLDVEHEETVDLETAQASAAIDLAWAAGEIAKSLDEISTQLSYIGSKLPGE